MNSNYSESCVNPVKDSINNTYKVRKTIATVESYFDGSENLYDILFEIAQKRLTQN